MHATPPALIRNLQGVRGRPLDDRDELDVVRAEVVAQKAIDLAAAVTVDGVNGCQDVPVDVVPLEDVKARDHPLEGRLAALVDPIGVVHGRRTVNRYPDEEPVLCEEGAPL